MKSDTINIFYKRKCYTHKIRATNVLVEQRDSDTEAGTQDVHYGVSLEPHLRRSKGCSDE